MQYLKLKLTRVIIVADFDGDVLSVKVLYSDEANAEAKALASSKTDKVDILGTLSKQTGNEIAQGLAVLTRQV